MNFKRKLSLVLAATLITTAALSGCGGNNSSTPPQDAAPSGSTGTTLGRTDISIAQKSDIKSTDPHISNDTTTHVALNHLYNKLVKIDEKGEIQNDLAESYSYVSDTELNFKLKQGVKFHNGEELKASDVKFSFDRQKESARVAQKIEAVKEVKVLGDYEVAIILERPSVTILSNLAHPGSSILNEKAVTEAGDKYNEKPCGTGPMKFDSWVPNDHVKLVRFDDYFGGAGRTTSLTIKVIPEGSSRTIALETGDVDIVVSVEKIDIPNLEANKDTTPIMIPSTTIEYFAMNTQKAPFDNPKVRQAFNHAINKDNLVTVVLEGEGETVNTVVSNKVRGYDSTINPYEYSVEKAKALLTEAGYPNGFEMTIFVSGDVRNREAQLIQADLALAGITAKIELYEWGAFLDAINAGQHQTFISGWSNSSLDPDESINPMFHSRNFGATGNRTFYSNPEVDALIDEAVTESDNTKRMQMYSDIQKMVMADAPWAPLFCGTVCVGARVGLDGLNPHPVSSNTLYNDVVYVK